MPPLADRSLLDVVVRAHKRGQPFGVYSICSAHPYALQAGLAHAQRAGAPLLIESTCNQVNQFGGYTGMTPADFASYVRGLARQRDFPLDRIMLGSDHLGPSAWQEEPAGQAMEKARRLARECVHAGYTKLHLDASMKLADDPADAPLDPRVAAGRAADLAASAEEAYRSTPAAVGKPRYVIGAEVPPPGGMQHDEAQATVSDWMDVEETIELTEQAFLMRGLGAAWERVVAVVVEPGVEYGDRVVFKYDHSRAAALSHFIERYEGLVYEAHSTDYQTCPALTRMVADHFAILKVGPALTFAFREAVFALSHIEEELLTGRDGMTLSGAREALDAAMLADPGYWRKYYTGDPAEQRVARAFSLSDRARYYWPTPEVQAALERLLANLRAIAPIHPALLSQYLPVQQARIRAGQLSADPDALILDKIEDVLADYACACGHEART
jgi:D-tagatose-1,6-bisphosphate aldolase subunit GatZ/KbaZ